MTASTDTTRTGGSTGLPNDLLVERLRRLLSERAGRPVRLAETHISWVLMDGEHAFKIKKPVNFGFVDFSSLQARRRFCEEEVRLNRRLAAELYLGVVAIRGSPEAPSFDGDGEPIEYAVKMRQFAAGELLSERLAAGTLTSQHVDRLAHKLAEFHETADVAPEGSAFGTAGTVVATALQTLAGLEAQGMEGACAELRRWLESQARPLEPAWTQRKAQGRIRECHGDLHLGNAVVLQEQVTAFDCIEFDPALRWIDVISDTAFLVMDLVAHGRRDLGLRFLNAWLEGTGDYPGLPVLRWYLVCRAMVRALVQRLQPAPAASTPDYLGVALELARPGQPRLMITHGVSGSGKSYFSQRLLEQAGAIRIRSDVERKRLFGMKALERSEDRVDSIYTPDATRRTYARLLELACVALDAGYPVIVDAAFLREEERSRFAAAARERGVPFAILACHAPTETLRERVRAREQRGDDPSEAGMDVLEAQRSYGEPLGEIERAFAIDAGVAAGFEAAVRWLIRTDP